MIKSMITSFSESYKHQVCFLGMWFSILTAVSAAAALGIAITTAPPRSGPFCMFESCIVYPYTDVAAFVPNDYIWMYPAFLMPLFFTILVICIHHLTPAGKRIYSCIALFFAVISAASLSINYFIQLSVVQPCLLKGEIAGLSLLSQYNPHGVFIALEDAGYLMMGLAFLFVAASLIHCGRLMRVTRILFIVSGALAAGLLILLSALFGSELEYIYEVIVIVIDWITLIVAGALLSVFFKQARC